MRPYDVTPIAKSLGIVHGYITERRRGLGEDFTVFVVWYSYVLGNHKALISSTLGDDMYYEVTFNKDKSEFYLDSYKKVENVVLPEGK